jgi:hypothetical protein
VTKSKIGYGAAQPLGVKVKNTVTADERRILSQFWDAPTDLEFLARQEELAGGQVEMVVKMSADDMPLELPPPIASVLLGADGRSFVRFVPYGK